MVLMMSNNGFNMYVETSWNDSQETVILQVFPSSVTEEEVLDVAKRTYALIESKPYLVDLLIDMRETVQHPVNLFGFWNKEVAHWVHPRQRHMAIIVTSVFEQIWLQTAMTLGLETARNMNICSNMHEATQRLLELRQPKLSSTR